MISLCMIVKNEEHCLKRCLNSVKDCVDEIIIVDTGSNDNTVNIAKQFGAKVFHYRWNDDFAAARNFSISNASGDWIFYLDADEELEPHCSQRFRTLANNPGVEGYYFVINNLNDGNTSLRHINVRMFRNKPEYRFEGRLHEQILNTILAANEKNVVTNSGISIFHYGYLASEYAAKNKGERNYRIIKKMLAEHPDDPFHLYNMGNCLINLNDLTGATLHYGKALKNINLKATYAPSVFIAYISCLLQLGNWFEAARLIEICKTLYPDYVDIHFLEGEFYTRLGHLERGKLCYQQCLRLGEKYTGRYTTRTGSGSFSPLFQLAQIYKKQGKLEKAIEYQIQGLKLKNDDLRNYITLAQLLKTHLKDKEQLLNTLSETVKQGDKTEKKLLLARLLNAVEEYNLSLKLLNQLSDKLEDVCYLKGLALIKLGRCSEAIQVLKQINNRAGTNQTARQELIFAHWFSTPAADASMYIQPSEFQDRDLYQTFKYINNILFNRPSSGGKVSLHSHHFRQIIDKILSYKQPGLILKILNLCGTAAPMDMIKYLITWPVTGERIELLAKLALQEIKKGCHKADYYYVLAWYFSYHHELNTAHHMLNKALTAHPESKPYRKLLKDIYLQQTLKIVLEALKLYPGSEELNKYLIAIQKERINSISLKGVH
ncbi:glycosyltransferase involved in cell wall biosynthesis [Desulfohalotomaculum tongense]|uniref:TPR domain-containing glycosyltransferase n=1 Tax=Desulforadius tongensis TaxID=1216062 RepID=UPI00195640A2|nr:TPR domain-containing glycosyltransferase [Desulforadius tongensis]MBM7854299.1 glycosyltransferase involved in cell wall biosynthesis [Desulforadius tongensis]